MTSTLHTLAAEFGKAFLPLQEAMETPDDFIGFMRELGWSIKDIPAPIAATLPALQQLSSALTPILQGDTDPAKFEALIAAIRGFIQKIDALKNAQFDPELAAVHFAETFPKQVIEYLLVEYLVQEQQKTAFLLRALGIIKYSYADAVSADHNDYIKREIVWVDLAHLLQDPVQIFENLFGWRTENFAAEIIFRMLSDLLISAGLTVGLEGLDEKLVQRLENSADTPVSSSRLALNIILFEKVLTDGVLRAGLRLLKLPKDGALLPGLALLPYLNGKLDQDFPISDHLALTVDSSLNLEGGVGLKLRPSTGLELIQGLNDPDTSSPAQGGLRVSLVNSDQSGNPIVLVGSEDGSRFEYKALSLKGGLVFDVQKNQTDLFIELAPEGARLVIKAQDADSFLQEILPKDGLESDLNLAVGLSQRKGFYFRDSSALEATLPIHRSLGPIELQSIDIAVKVNSASSAVPLSLGATVKAEFGPLTAVVENIGLTARFTFPEDHSGILGPLDLSIGFKAPDGVGLSIEGEGLTGGGFLKYIDADQSYEGMLDLVYEDRINLKAIGMITTRLPGGESGYSLLILITAEFEPIQLGLGFTLNGVGGLLGYNRSVAVERLRSGLRDGTLNSILFPQDVIANAPRILSDLRQVFPPTAGHFIFGPVARLGWGSPPLLTIDLGLILELPSPLRLIILGVLRMALPTDDEVLLQLQVNFLGVIDFNAGTLAFDAHLFDSHLLGLTLDGDMAVRVKWTGEKNLLLSVGGFHPLYQPPPLDLPKLSRITINLLPGKDPRLTLETYYAVTSNTYQFGAKIELYASAGSFAVHGLLAYDVLFQRSPFHFSASAEAKLDLLAGSSCIAGIHLSLTLEGPTPYHAHGTAHLEICWFLEISVHFDFTWGEDRDTTLPAVAVLPLLHDALADASNWQTSLPQGKNLLVTYRKVDPTPGQLLIAPAGILTITQKVVPLNVTIQTFGDQAPADATLFSIEQVTSGAGTLSKTSTPEDFAPGQFFERSNTEKLTGKSFEQYDGGVRIDDSGVLQAEYAAARDVTYQVFYKDPQRPQPVQAPGKEHLQLEGAAFEAFAVGGAVARSPLSHARRGEPAGLPGAVSVGQEQFSVVRSLDLSPLADGQVFQSEAEALVHLHQLLGQQPELEGEVQVIPAYEMSPT